MVHLSGNAAWTNTAATPIDMTALENIETAIDGAASPLAGLRTGKLYMKQAERVTVATQTEYTMATISGPGCVRSVWMAIGNGAPPALDGRLRVYYDGSGTPAIDIDMGTLFAIHVGAGSFAGAHSTPHLSAQINSANYNVGLLITFPMPFGTSISVRYYNPSASIAASFYHMTTYTLSATDLAAGMRFRVAGLRYADQLATVTHTQTYTMLTAASGQPGWVVGHSYIGGVSATNLSWMERDFQIAVDGESTPSPGSGTQIVATGTEDWFDSAWYFNTWKDFQSSIHSYVGADTAASGAYQYAVGMTTDFWSKWGGVPFTTSCVFTMLTESACTTTQSFTYAVLYYQ